MTTPDLPDSVIRFLHHNARILSHRFPMVDRDDIAQEMWVWVVNHPKAVARFLADPEGDGKLRWAMRNAGLAHCHREKAKKHGYSVDDLQFYSLKAIRAILPAVYDTDAWARLGRGDCDPGNGINPDPARPDRRMDAIAALTDVKVAVGKLPPDVRRLIERVFRDEWTPEQLAGHYRTTEGGARMRVQRALRRVQRELGGERPVWNQ